MKIVQLGANKGYDSLFRYLENHKSEIELLVLVEPFRLHLDNLKECYKDYKNVIIENVAVKPSFITKEDLTIYYYEKDGPAYHVASINPSHIYKHYGNVNLDSFTIPSFTIEQILNKHDLKELDWLLIDVEGLDAELILNFDWSSYNIKRIDVEHLHLGDSSQEVLNLLASLGYKRIESTNTFDWAFELEGNTIHTVEEDGHTAQR
jgi:FkbM family methyltransferase